MDLGSTCGQTGACTKASGDVAKHTERANSRGHLGKPTRGTSSQVGWKGSVLSSDSMGPPTTGLGAPIESIGTERSITIGRMGNEAPYNILGNKEEWSSILVSFFGQRRT